MKKKKKLTCHVVDIDKEICSFIDRSVTVYDDKIIINNKVLKEFFSKGNDAMGFEFTCNGISYCFDIRKLEEKKK